MASRCARRFALTLSLAATLAAVAAASSRVDAKTFFYAHGVHAEGEPTDIAAEQLLVGESAFHDIGIDDSLAVGGRIGVWFDRVPWLGLALDGSYVAPETSGVEIQVMSLTPMLMLRAPLLKSMELPTGRLQPYVAVAPGIYFSQVEDDLLLTLTRDFESLSTEAGLAWRVTQNLTLFAEYRRTGLGSASRVNERIDTDLDADRFLAGLSLRF